MQNALTSIGHVVTATNRNTDLLKTLAYKQIDLEARSRRNNLIFWGIHEQFGENCFQLIREVITNRLDLDGRSMYLTRAHRLGQRKIGQHARSRPIIVNFRDFNETERIMANVHMLRSSPISIDLDLPKEIHEARKRLWPKLKEAKNQRSKAHIVYPAKLIVDGRVEQDEFPDWFKTISHGRIIDFSHVSSPFKQQEDGTPSDTIQDETPLNLQSMAQHQNTSGSSTRTGDTTTQTITIPQYEKSMNDSHCSDDSVVQSKNTTDQSEIPAASSTPWRGGSTLSQSQQFSSPHAQPSIFRSCAPANIPMSNLRTPNMQTTDDKSTGEEVGHTHSSRSATRTMRRSTPYKRYSSDSRSRERFSRSSKNRSTLDTRDNQQVKPSVQVNNNKPDTDHGTPGAANSES